ncbi:MAG: VWA domain-containing protein [Bacillota bacterium]
MKTKILEFVGLLRKAGLRITSGEVLDCLVAIKILGFEKETFFNCLQTTLVKETKDLKVFYKIFHLYFQDYLEIKEINKFLQKYPQFTGTEKAFSLNADRKGIARSGVGGPTPDLFYAITQGEFASLQKHIELLVQKQMDLSIDEAFYNVESITRNIQIELEWFMALSKLERTLECNLISLEYYQKLLVELDHLKEWIKTKIEGKIIEKYDSEALEKIAESENLYKKDFICLNPNQVQELEKRIRQLGAKLATKKSHRLRPAKNGRVDLRRVVKVALQCGGIPIKLKFVNKKVCKPQLVLLCDISGSVAQFSRFMLQLVYLSQAAFRDVKVFVFIDHLVNVTDLFKHMDIDDILAELPYLTKVSETGYSHFGNVFNEFYHGFIDILNDKTTIIILGDARNNWRPSGLSYLAEMKQRCYRLIWMNPQPREEWNSKDSIIGIYEKNCSKVFECRNMEQLEGLIKKIF